MSKDTVESHWKSVSDIVDGYISIVGADNDIATNRLYKETMTKDIAILVEQMMNEALNQQTYKLSPNSDEKMVIVEQVRQSIPLIIKKYGGK